MKSRSAQPQGELERGERMADKPRRRSWKLARAPESSSPAWIWDHRSLGDSLLDSPPAPPPVPLGDRTYSCGFIVANTRSRGEYSRQAGGQRPPTPVGSLNGSSCQANRMPP
ncbi:Hypothetical predicted protein [Podarcis lilfordi]|uniref:Uncharacterized protein n=1 Tax=Podarcis lilfordi TaxID=74358 RepID=A0AA35KFV5_9SAUR|nr:Hypothetical predicted protein [Podarcis lilfordi]